MKKSLVLFAIICSGCVLESAVTPRSNPVFLYDPLAILKNEISLVSKNTGTLCGGYWLFLNTRVKSDATLLVVIEKACNTQNAEDLDKLLKENTDPDVRTVILLTKMAISFASRNTTSAIELASLSTEINANDWRPHFHLHHIHKCLGDIAAAESELKLGSSIYPPVFTVNFQYPMLE